MTHQLLRRLLCLALSYHFGFLSTVAAQSEPQPIKKLTTKADSIGEELQHSLLERLQSTDLNRRLEALKELIELKKEAKFALPQLLEILHRPVTIETAYAIRSLRMIGSDAAVAVPRIHQLLKESVAKEPEIVSLPLSALLSESKPSVGMIPFEAAMALCRMGPAGEVAIPTLVRMLKNPAKGEKRYRKPRSDNNFSPSAEGYAALLYHTDEKGTFTNSKDLYLLFVLGCLEQFGSASKVAIPALQDLQNDPDTLPYVSHSAGELIEKIEKISH